MKSQEEIELMIAETQTALGDVQEWVNQAYDKYQQERRMWGLSADNGELHAAHDAQKVLIEKINVLNWVLGK